MDDNKWICTECGEVFSSADNFGCQQCFGTDLTNDEEDV